MISRKPAGTPGSARRWCRAAGRRSRQARRCRRRSGISRQARGGRGVTRRVTPSGEICTRRSASRAATAARSRHAERDQQDVERRRATGRRGRTASPVNGIAGERPAQRKNRPKPTAVPATAATVDSTAEITETCRGVAPTRRIAANRCSRRAADSRVAVPMKISTGNSSAAADDRQDEVDAVGVDADVAAVAVGWATVRDAGDLRRRPACCDSSSAVRPTTMIKRVRGRAARRRRWCRPAVPGKRSPSSVGRGGAQQRGSAPGEA